MEEQALNRDSRDGVKVFPQQNPGGISRDCKTVSDQSCLNWLEESRMKNKMGKVLNPQIRALNLIWRTVGKPLNAFEQEGRWR